MHRPKDLSPSDTKLALQIIEQHSFATLLTVREETPFVSHLPFMFDPARGTNGTLIGHMARANPQWRSFRPETEALVIFQGPHAYISPRWFGPSSANLPAWNYAAVHLYGLPCILSDETLAYAVITDLVAIHDPNWSIALSDKEKQEMLRQIVAFELDVTKIEPRLRLSQSRSPDERQLVIEQLRRSASQNERETADLMERVTGEDMS